MAEVDGFDTCKLRHQAFRRGAEQVQAISAFESGQGSATGQNEAAQRRKVGIIASISRSNARSGRAMRRGWITLSSAVYFHVGRAQVQRPELNKIVLDHGQAARSILAAAYVGGPKTTRSHSSRPTVP